MCKQKNILCLDLGTKTGWVLLDKNGSFNSGTIDFSNKRIESLGRKYYRFFLWLDEIRMMSDGIDTIFFEEVRRHAGVQAAHAYGGFSAIVLSFCEDHEIEYESIPVGSIKKHITGKGNASKQDVIKAVNKTYSLDVQDDNEADAIAIYDFVKKNNKV